VTAVKVWVGGLDVAPAVEASLWPLLDAAEQARAQRFAFDHLRRRYTVAHAMLRLLLAARLGADPAGLRFTAGEHGKPALSTGDGPEFSLAHSGERALVALSDQAAVGVDIEQVRALRDADAVARRIMADGLLAAYGAAADPTLFLLDVWARKEAVLKASGEGITRALREVDISAASAMDVEPGYVAAAALDGPGPPSCTVRAWAP
jgi:4'-phosphopantetheinyl transferase